jgi:hypothetical protein
MGVPSCLLAFSPGALRLSPSGRCEKEDAAAQEGTPIPLYTALQGAAPFITALE